MTGSLRVAFSLLFIWISKQLIDTATHGLADGLAGYIGCLVGCMALQLLLAVVHTRREAKLEIRFRNGLRSRLFNHLLESRWQGGEQLHSGDLLNRLTEDISVVTTALCRDIPMLFTIGVQLVGALYFLFRLDQRLAVALPLVMPVALLLSKLYVGRARRLSREIRSMDSRIQSHIQEHWQHRVLVRAFEYNGRVSDKLSLLQTRLQERLWQRLNLSTYSRFMVQTGFSTGYMVAFLWGVFGLRDGNITFGMMAAFLQLVSQVQRPIVELSRRIPAFIQVLTATERLSELASFPLEEQGAAIRLQGKVGIRLQEVDFAYTAGARNVLNRLTHDFEPGSRTAVMGETGIGKSTLVRLVLALLVPDNGTITFYNRETAIIASPQTRCNLSYIPQGNTLISGSIRDNLLLGNPLATEEELYAALHTAAADFVSALPEGLETHCGEQGNGLSEGQAQRIAIARGLLRPCSVLLLDEPTSSLDEETGETLLYRLFTHTNDKTLLLITHQEKVAQRCTHTLRLSTDDDCAPRGKSL